MIMALKTNDNYDVFSDQTFLEAAKVNNRCNHNDMNVIL